jgi:hypothetical protein
MRTRSAAVEPASRHFQRSQEAALKAPLGP